MKMISNGINSYVDQDYQKWLKWSENEDNADHFECNSLLGRSERSKMTIDW